MIDKKNVSFICVQNVDNIGLDGNKSGQANTRAAKSVSGCARERERERYVKIELMREIFSQHVVSCLTLINRKFFMVQRKNYMNANANTNASVCLT